MPEDVDPAISTPLTTTYEVHQVVQRAETLRAQIASLLGPIQEAHRQVLLLQEELGRLAANVPEGYVHQPGCVWGPAGWHTCRPIPASKMTGWKQP